MARRLTRSTEGGPVRWLSSGFVGQNGVGRPVEWHRARCSRGTTGTDSFTHPLMPDIYEFLDGHGIAYQRCDHPAVFTVAEMKRLVPPLDGAHTKNLFLRDKKGRRHVLVVVGSDKQVDIKALSAALGLDHLSSGSPERLRKYLGIEPGSVSLLALLNDIKREVEVFIDRELWLSLIHISEPTRLGMISYAV